MKLDTLRRINRMLQDNDRLAHKVVADTRSLIEELKKEALEKRSFTTPPKEMPDEQDGWY